jgi:hypothetical protein
MIPRKPPLTTHGAFPLALLLLAGQAQAAEGRDVPLAAVCAGVTKARPADPEGIIQVKMVAKPRDMPSLPADLSLQLEHSDGKATPIALDADNGFDPRCDDPAMRDAVVHINQPRSRVRFGLAFPARVPAGTAMSYAKLAESVPVMIEAIRLQAGLLRFLAPKVRGVRLTFPAQAGQHVTIRLPGGDKRFDADARGVVVVPWNPDWSTATVQLSEPLRAIAPDLH